MNKRNRILTICLLSISISLACAQVAKFQATATPLPTATIQPTATLQPTVIPIPGWKKFEGGGIALWLPESFKGGDISEDLELIVEQIRALGSEFEPYAKLIEQNPSMFALWAYDSDLGESRFLTNIGVSSEQVLSVIDIDTYLDASEKQLPAQLHMVGWDSVSLNGQMRGG